jgi:pyruvate-formate lyase
VLIMNNFKVKNKRKDMRFEINFTNTYREAKRRFSHPARIELECLKCQYPAILHQIEDDDLFAGRIEFGAVGLGIQHQTGGFGYFIDEPRVVYELEHRPGSGKYREDLHDMLVFWRSENTNAKVLQGMPANLKEALPTDDWLGQPLPANPILRMAGSYLDFDKLVRIGIPGLEAEMRQHLAREQKNGGDVILFQCMLGALELLKEVCLFYKKQALEKKENEKDPSRSMQYDIMAQVLESITLRKPETMREAIQLVWIYSLLTPQIEFGRMDVYLGDLYVHDIENGIISENEALEMVQSFFRLIDHLDCEVDGRVIIGGYGRRNRENADKFCLVAIEACRTVKEVLPQFTLRFSRETPPEVWSAALRCIEEGRTYPLLYNDDVLVPGIMKAFGVDCQRAESYVPLGCGEIEFDHYSFGTPSGAINVLKVLEITMHGGYDPVSGKRFGPATKTLAECETFEEFYEEYTKQLDYYIAAQAEFEMYEYQKTGEIHSFMYVTMLYDGCCEKGKAIFNGGCASLNGTLEVYGLVNAGDSLTAIKKLIYEDKVLTPDMMMEILDSNFHGYEKERKMMMDCPKYGNDNPYADSMVVDLHKYICEEISRQAPRVGLDTYLAVVINNAQNTTLARWVGASADGRKAGTPMANANNPSPGADKNGITSMLNSILKLPHDNHAGMVQNIRLSRELFTSARDKVTGLINNYFERGGAHAMITVVGKDDLHNAMKNPDAYRDLIVRIGGFSARFVDLPKDVQKEVYERVTY